MDRTEYIGSSDASKICDRAAWPYLYLLKKGIAQEPALSESFPVQLGKHTESFHADWTAAQNPGWEFSAAAGLDEDGYPKQHFGTYELSTGFLLGSSQDMLVRLPDANVYGAELKHTSTERFRDTDEAVQNWMPQLQHHMLVWGHTQILFSAIRGNSAPEPVWVSASPKWQRWYLEECCVFAQYLAESMPPPDLNPTEVPIPVRNSVPINGKLVRDLQGSNEAMNLLAEYNVLKKAAAEFEDKKLELRDLCTDEDNEVFVSEYFKIKRDKKGVRRITVWADDYGMDK